MGEVLLDSENLFFGFGWTPMARHQPERRDFLRQFAGHPRLENMSDQLAVESLGGSSVHALADWARRHLATSGDDALRRLSYGKKDRGVRTVLDALSDEGYTHIFVAWGRNVAEQRILQRLDAQTWRRGPYVIGSSDKAVAKSMNSMLTDNPEVRAVLVMRPDVYEREKGTWFHSTTPDQPPHFPMLGEYGTGHVALHKITNDYLAAQSAARTRRATPPAPVIQAAVLTPRQRWDLWLRHPAPKPTPERPLSSTAWVKACRNRMIPAAVFRPLRDSVKELYGDAFETGDGPVAWGLACRAAASVPLVRAHPVSPPDGLDVTWLAAYQEAWARLMSRPRGATAVM